MTTVLVTGGMGFIGSHTVDCLIKNGYNVKVVDNLERQVHQGRRPKFLNPRAKYVTGDLRFVNTWQKALADVDRVVHLAAVVGVGQSFWQARKYTEVNVGSTATLFELIVKEPLIKKKIKKIVVASSKSVYGEGAYVCSEHGQFHPEPRPLSQLKKKQWDVQCSVCGRDTKPIGMTEDKPPQNLSPYALTKYATEKLAIDYSLATDIPTVAFRYFNVYGPRQSLSNPYTGVIAIFLTRLKNNNPPIIFEDGMQLRDFVYVGDVARLNGEAIENETSGVFNLGTSKPNSLLQMVSFLKEILGVNTEPKVTYEYRPGDNRHDFSDITKLRSNFRRTSFVPVREGLKKLIDWSQAAEARDLLGKEEKERIKYIGAQK